MSQVRLGRNYSHDAIWPCESITSQICCSAARDNESGYTILPADGKGNESILVACQSGLREFDKVHQDVSALDHEFEAILTELTAKQQLQF
jgi:hypothetical protein